MKVDGVGKIVEGVNALEAALNSNRVKKVIVLDTKHNKSNKFNFLIEDIKSSVFFIKNHLGVLNPDLSAISFSLDRI